MLLHRLRVLALSQDSQHLDIAYSDGTRKCHFQIAMEQSAIIPFGSGSGSGSAILGIGIFPSD